MNAAALKPLAALAALLALCSGAVAQDGRRTQEIAFPELPDRTVGDAAFELAAKASSGLPVSFVIVEGSAVLDGKKLKLVDVPGLVLVRATQAGNAVFQPAKPVSRGFSVNPKPSPPSFVTQPQSAQVEVGSIVALSAGASGVPLPSLQWRKDGTPLAGATDRTFTIPSAAMTDTGSYDVVASNPSGALASARVNLSVVKRHQFITFQGPTSVVAGQSVSINAIASSGLPVRLDVISGMAVLRGTTLVAGAGTVVVQANQPGDANTEAAQPVSQTFTVSADPSGLRLQ